MDNREERVMDNPHERRGGSLADYKAMAMGLPSYERPRSFLTLADLDVMAQNAAGRACDELKGKLEREHDEETRIAQLRAWEDGHRYGVDAGERAMLDRIDAQYGDQIRQLIDDTRVVLKADKAELIRTRLESVVELLGSLVQAHHNGFQDPPF